MNVSNSEIADILKRYKKITVVGLSRDSSKVAQRVPLSMRDEGYELVGVHPSETSIEGVKCYPSIASVPAPDRKFINIFRPSSEIAKLVDEVLAAGDTEVLWLQLGITDPAAEARAEAAGLRVISNRCIAIEYGRLS